MRSSIPKTIMSSGPEREGRHTNQQQREKNFRIFVPMSFPDGSIKSERNSNAHRKRKARPPSVSEIGSPGR